MSRSPLQSERKQWRSATKRQILGGFSNNQTNSPVPVDGSNPQHVQMMIKDLEQKYNQMVVSLRTGLEDYHVESEAARSTGLMKIPTAVRNMTVKDFNKKYSCDLLSLLKSKDGVRVSDKKPRSASEHAGQKRDYQHSVMQTPAPRIRGQEIPATAVRTARRGEGLFSQNGSPLETTEKGSVVATVTKKRRGNESANFEINVGDGKYISLSDPDGVQELDSSMKATAASQLKVLQDQMASLMAQLTK